MVFVVFADAFLPSDEKIKLIALRATGEKSHFTREKPVPVRSSEVIYSQASRNTRDFPISQIMSRLRME